MSSSSGSSSTDGNASAVTATTNNNNTTTASLNMDELTPRELEMGCLHHRNLLTNVLGQQNSNTGFMPVRQDEDQDQEDEENEPLS